MNFNVVISDVKFYVWNKICKLKANELKLVFS